MRFTVNFLLRKNGIFPYCNGEVLLLVPFKSFRSKMFFRTINEGGRGTSEGKANHLFKLARMIFSPKGIVFGFFWFFCFSPEEKSEGPGSYRSSFK